jgi:D-alanyl-D-alanine carboxypeptidase
MVKKLVPIFLLLLAPSLLIADCAGASNLSSARNKGRANDAEISALGSKLQAKLNELHQAASFPGATIGFVLPDGRSGSVSVGLADVENRIPLKPADRMLAGSIGKTYVSAAMLQIVQEGKLDLDAKIERWFGRDAWFPRLPNAKDITLRMLMNNHR